MLQELGAPCGCAAGGQQQEEAQTRGRCTGEKASPALKALGGLWLTRFPSSHLEGSLTNASKTRKLSTRVKFCRNRSSFCTGGRRGAEQQSKPQAAERPP